MNFELIEKLEETTPACAECRGVTHFIPGHAYQLLKCETCGKVTKAPTSLTRTIVAAYHPLPGKNTTQKRIQPCIL